MSWRRTLDEAREEHALFRDAFLAGDLEAHGPLQAARDRLEDAVWQAVAAVLAGSTPEGFALTAWLDLAGPGAAGVAVRPGAAPLTWASRKRDRPPMAPGGTDLAVDLGRLANLPALVAAAAGVAPWQTALDEANERAEIAETACLQQSQEVLRLRRRLADLLLAGERGAVQATEIVDRHNVDAMLEGVAERVEADPVAGVERRQVDVDTQDAIDFSRDAAEFGQRVNADPVPSAHSDAHTIDHHGVCSPHPALHVAPWGSAGW
ncbi:MAG: hypothetical protein R3F60_14810 [bacterium]